MIQHGGGRISEFIIDVTTGEFVSQWNVSKLKQDGTYDSDPDNYKILDCGDVANTESFNYGPSKGKNDDRPKGDNNSHTRLDVKRPDDTDLREQTTKKWTSENDFNDSDEPGNYADIVKEGEVDVKAWREVPEDKRKEIYDKFVDYCRNNGNDNNGFSEFWQGYNKK